MDSIARELGIRTKGEFSEDGSYVINLPNSDEWGKVYSIIDDNEEVEKMTDNSLVQDDGASLLYRYKGVQINLLADLFGDSYQVVFTEI